MNKKRILVLTILFIMVCSSLIPHYQVSAASDNEHTIYEYLINSGFNTAAAVGILANIEAESSFNPNAYGDYVNGTATSYGICQWHNDRWTNLKNYRPNDWTTLNGQLAFLVHELQVSRTTINTYMRNSIPNTGDGAYEAGRYWCYWFEVPANRDNVSVTRGNRAKNYFWPRYYTEVRGSKMTTGYDRVLPDGNYMIASAANSSYFLDIQGTAVPAANGTNVQLYQTTSGEVPDSDAWTITYYASGFYKIAQYGQDVSLDVPGSDTLRGQNVQVWKNDPNSAGQKWAVSKNGNNGYRLEAQCSGYSLDVSGGTIANNSNIQQWEDNNTAAQSWVFIPYKPSQPVAEGRYILLYTPDRSYELDVSGDTGSVSDGTNVQLWSDTAPSRYNSFDLTKLSNGYYKLTHAASGKCLTVAGGSTTYRANVEVSTDNGSTAQQWAIISSGTGYCLVSKANGYAIDLPSSVTGNGKNLQTYPRLGTGNQQWTFVRAEHTVRFDANGGTGAPGAVTKYYKTSLTLPSAVPQRTGYRFLGWSASSGATTPSYSAGGTYTADNDITLYAVWEPLTYVVSFDSAGAGAYDPITVNHGETVSLPVPQRLGFLFEGWYSSDNRLVTDSTAIVTNLSLTARWTELTRMTLPVGLSEIEDEAFVGTAPEMVVIPDAVRTVGRRAFADNEHLYTVVVYSRTMTVADDAFENCPNLTVYGYSNSSIDTYCSRRGIPFVALEDTSY